jgi:hypothetical protein
MVAAESSIEDDRDRNMVVAKTIRTPTAIVTSIMKHSVSLPLFTRDFAWCAVGVIFIGWSPVAGMAHPN